MTNSVENHLRRLSARPLRCSWIGLVALLALAAAAPAAAQMPVRSRTLVEGDYTVTGNDFMDCAATGPCSNNNSSVLHPVDRDPLTMGDLNADGSDDTTVSSAATLSLPAAAVVRRAELIVYQSNARGTPYNYPVADSAYTMLLGREGDGYTAISPSTVTGGGTTTYFARYDVTAIVTASRAGLYWAAEMEFAPSTARNIVSFWAISVIYELAGEPLRAITEYGPLNRTCYNNSTSTPMLFTTPMGAAPASRLTVMGGDGHRTATGDRVLWDGTPLSNPANPSNNIGNSTVSDQSGAITRIPMSYRVVESADIDLFDISSLISAGQTDATLTFTCGLPDGIFWLGAFHSVDVVAPNVELLKSVRDINGGVARPGDVLEYTVTMNVAMGEDALETVLTDTLPADLTYVAGSLEIATGPNAGALSDPADVDQGEVAGQVITVRLGAGADGTTGGTVANGTSTSIRFRARIAAMPSATIENQAGVRFIGPSTGAAVYSAVSSGPTGTGPTITPVVRCGDGTLQAPEVCDDGDMGAGDGCSATCTLEPGFVCVSGPPAGPCGTGGPGSVTRVVIDLVSPTGSQSAAAVTPSGTSSAPDGAMVSVTVTGDGGPFTCTATVSSGAWACSPGAITGLTSGEDYTATATVMSGTVSASDRESFDVRPCVGVAAGGMCTDNRGAVSVAGVCSLAGGAGACVPCLDDGTGVMTDAGCTDSAPLCEGTASPGGAGTGCTSCVDDTTDGTDLGCGLPAAAGPVCDTSGSTDVCVACEPTAGTDNGCSDAAPVCMRAIGAAPVCVECTDDAHCPAMGEVCGGDNMCVSGCNDDRDCAEPLPICDTAGRTCVQCLTDGACAGDDVCSAGGVCGAPDHDGDGTPDDVDLDDDNDGVLDTDEGGGTDLSLDSDGDGWPDYKDPDSVTCADTSPMDGACDELPRSVDFDGDGVPNHFDLDADGDGIPDTREAGGSDTDGDGVVDGFADLNGNGVADSVDASALPTPDTDMDLSPDFLDLDADGDGITDAFEGGGADADGDGLEDTSYVDSDGDGLNDNLTGASALAIPDTDGDGEPDFQDLDADNDDVPDAVEGHRGAAPSGVDMDGDGIDDAFDPDCTAATMCGAVVGVPAPVPSTDGGSPDFRDIDADGDGILDGVECPLPAACADTDADGVPDFRSLDADGDGLPDAQEGHDADHDGDPDVTPVGADNDGDGLDDAFDPDCSAATPCGATVGVPAPVPDLDSDMRPDFQDPDDDGDGITTAQELQDAADYTGSAPDPTDVDADGLPNWYDVDSDADGATDMTEDSRPALDGDLDDNGILDYLDPGFAPADTDGDGILDVLECAGRLPVDDSCPDSDMDGSPDWRDVDDDNDGILTAVEYSADDPDDGDPANDHDADNDGIPNHLDLDSDNDGIPDLTENGYAAADADGDGRADSATDADMDGLLALFDADDADAMNVGTTAPVNTDMVGAPDFLDLDADGDGLLDILEADGVDSDGDGVVDDASDGDMDGLADVVDGSPWPTPDTDEDGAFDFQDVDSDGDGASDAIEASDTNHDGVADITPAGADADGDGIDDAFEGAGGTPSQPDTDMDGLVDWRDPDDDGDGVPSSVEVLAGDTDGDGVPDYLDPDDDGDTIPTAMENPDPDGDGSIDDAQDTDGNGVPDYLDPDDDGDSILTRFENPDPNGDGDPDDGQDTDADGTPDYLDPDDDGDGTPTIEELPDPDGDGDPADARDTDGDGVPDYLDPGASTVGGVSGGALCATSRGGGGGGLLWLLAAVGLITWRRRR